MMPKLSVSLLLSLGAGGVVQAAPLPEAVCHGGGCADDREEVGLLQTVNKAQRRDVGGVERHLMEQRDDDFLGSGPLVSVPQPGPSEVPPPFKEALPVVVPLPAPNPADNPFMTNYTGMNCQEEWPIFQNLVGVWAGHTGQNFIALPQANAEPLGKAFLVQVNRYSETFSFEAVGPVLNRGYLNGVQTPPVNQSDQVFSGVMFHESVMDLDLKAGIHEENGFILHQACRPQNAGLLDPWQVLRMSTIPHGSQPMGFGNISYYPELPQDDYYVQMLLRVRESMEFSVQPWVQGCGSKEQQQRTPGNNTGGPLLDLGCCIGGAGYMKGTDQCPQTGCPEPIDMLIDAVKDKKVRGYTELQFTSMESIGPNLPQGRFFPGIRGGGVQNTAYVNIVAEAEPRSFDNKVWHLIIEEEDGSTYEMIQYIQTVDLAFLAKGPGCPSQMWPHVDSNTLTRTTPKPTPTPPSPEPPSPEPTTSDPTEPVEVGTCQNMLCGCPKHGGLFKESWCSKERCSLGPWCSRSKKHCHECWGTWCEKQE